MNRSATIHLDGRARPWRSLATIARTGQTLLHDGRRGYLPTHPDRRADPRAGALLQHLAVDVCDHHRILIRVRGEPAPGPTIFVANHLSYLDPVVLCALVPALPIAKAEVSSWPILGRWIEATGALFVERGRPRSGARVLRRALEILRGGGSVLNFPEGTTTHGERVLPFHRGVFGLARLSGAAIVPVKIAYDARELCWVGDQGFLPHYLRFAGRTISTAFVSFHPPISSDRGDADTLAALARAALLSA